jgi:hypothetical protein
MSGGMLGRLGAVFIEPAPEASSTSRAVAPPRSLPPEVAVLAPAELGDLAGCALALALARAAGACSAVVCRWRAEAPALGSRPLALPRARSLAHQLRARGLEALAVGRIVHVALPDEEADAAGVARRAASAAPEAPTVTVIRAPRPAAFDAFLIAQDAIVVAAGASVDEHVADMAVRDLRALHDRVSRWRPPAGPLARMLALSGLGAPVAPPPCLESEHGSAVLGARLGTEPPHA